MGTAKDIVLRPIPAADANDLVRRVHYSGKIAQNSQIHIGVFYQGKLEGAMQFGPSLDKRKIQGLVRDTGWHEFIELNRMAFTDVLPRNSESRAIAIAMRLLRKYAPQLKWVVSFADATQCGDGTIYRASGFVLTGIAENKSTMQYDLCRITTLIEQENDSQTKRDLILFANHIKKNNVLHEFFFRCGPWWSDEQKAASNLYHRFSSKRSFFEWIGANVLIGFQLRYIYFLDPSYRQRLTVPELPYSEIERMGARMYKGEKRAGVVQLAEHQGPPDDGGSIPTRPLNEQVTVKTG